MILKLTCLVLISLVFFGCSPPPGSIAPFSYRLTHRFIAPAGVLVTRDVSENRQSWRVPSSPGQPEFQRWVRSSPLPF